MYEVAIVLDSIDAPIYIHILKKYYELIGLNIKLNLFVSVTRPLSYMI